MTGQFNRMYSPVRMNNEVTGAIVPMPITEAIVIDAVDRSVIETVEAFVRFRPGFHGDTGIRDYLYYRLMTNLPNGGTHTRADGTGTLLAQAEWYTQLVYRNTGNGPSPGRFDLGIPKPEELESPKPRALVAFECGRNKRASTLLQDVDAIAEHEGPQPGDITKLVREIGHKQLPYGYALEFFDKGRGSEATYLIDSLRRRICTATSERLHVAVAVCTASKKPVLTFLPRSWDERVRLNFQHDLTGIEDLVCATKSAFAAQHRILGGGHENRVSRESFLSSCSAETCALIEEIECRLGSRVKPIFGGKTMTINRRPTGKLLRINKQLSSIEDFNPDLDRQLAAIFQPGRLDSKYTITGTAAFREAIIDAMERILDSRP